MPGSTLIVTRVDLIRDEYRGTACGRCFVDERPD